jgi:signal transduction histidine kinase
MTLRFVDTRRAAGLICRRGAIVVLTTLAVAAVVALTALGIGERRADDTRASKETLAEAVDTAQTVLDGDRRLLARMTREAAAGLADDPSGQILGPLSDLAAGLRAAVLLDPAGVPLAHAAGGLDDGALAALGVAAARAVDTHTDAALLAIPAIRDDGGNPALAALVQPWSGAGGVSGGIAVIAIDRTAFAALDHLPALPKGSRFEILDADGSALFGGDSQAEAGGARQVALSDVPLLLRYRSPVNHAVRMLHAAAPFVLVALAGFAAALGLAIILGRRDRAQRREIARRTGVERKLRQELVATAAVADRTDEISRAKSRFFAQVTHELRTPLNAILGFSETIRHEMFGPVANPRYLEYVGLIHDAGSHLLSLINDLLDNARIEAGKMEIAPIRVSAAAVARSALDLVELLASERGIVLAASGLSDCPDLNVDARAMKQVLVNLLSNAIKYTSAGGKIDVRFAGRSDGGVTIEVADTGTGMSAEDVLYAFEPFGRGGADPARRQPGTGLGLSLARALVRLHGGDLTLASRLDAGTTATMSLPASAAFGAAGSASAPAKSNTDTTSARAA